MNQVLVSTAPASAPASSAWSVAHGSTPLSFRKDADDGFPAGGALLLVVLMAVAVWAWWYGRTQRGRVDWLSALPLRLGRPAGANKELCIVESLNAAGGVRLTVVEWAGGRRVLMAVQGANSPVALDVAPPSADEAGAKR